MLNFYGLKVAGSHNVSKQQRLTIAFLASIMQGAIMYNYINNQLAT